MPGRSGDASPGGGEGRGTGRRGGRAGDVGGSRVGGGFSSKDASRGRGGAIRDDQVMDLAGAALGGVETDRTAAAIEAQAESTKAGRNIGAGIGAIASAVTGLPGLSTFGSLLGAVVGSKQRASFASAIGPGEETDTQHTALGTRDPVPGGRLARNKAKATGGTRETGAQAQVGGGTTGQGAVRRSGGTGFKTPVGASSILATGLATTARKTLLGV